jgi:BCCT family betaine/carnitine transporter
MCSILFCAGTVECCTEPDSFFFGDTFGTYYLVIGLGIFILSLCIAGSKYGNIVLGEQSEKPKYSFFAWGSMMFTCGLAADILFYSFSEWVLYATDPHLAEMGSIQDWAGVYPLFHWSFIPWGFYLVLAVAFGFMLHVRKRNRQKYSEACRPILGKYTDGWAGRIIDLLAVFALLAGTATTFSVATPLMATIISELFHVAVSRTVINIIILLITCAVYTYSLLHGFKGISKLANICIYMFFGLIAFVLLFGGETRYIIETGFSSLGRMIQNLLICLRSLTRSVHRTSRRTGQSTIGLTGWYGAWQLRSLSEIYLVAERYVRRFLAVMYLVLDQL